MERPLGNRPFSGSGVLDAMSDPCLKIKNSLIHGNAPVIKNHPVVLANQSAASRTMVPSENWGVPPGWGRHVGDLRRGGGYLKNSHCLRKIVITKPPMVPATVWQGGGTVGSKSRKIQMGWCNLRPHLPFLQT